MKQSSMLLVAVLGTALCLGGCATPEYRAMLAAEAAAEAALECRQIKPIGSNLPQKVCHSSEDWVALEQKRKREADEYGRQSREGSTLVGDSTESSGFGTPTRLGL